MGKWSRKMCFEIKRRRHSLFSAFSNAGNTNNCFKIKSECANEFSGLWQKRVFCNICFTNGNVTTNSFNWLKRVIECSRLFLSRKGIWLNRSWWNPHGAIAFTHSRYSVSIRGARKNVNFPSLVCWKSIRTGMSVENSIVAMSDVADAALMISLK